MSGENINHRLATYGSLAPGQPNHNQLSDLHGHWQTGGIKGHLVPKGWSALLGYPALVLADDGINVDVHVFESSDLPDHWDGLDAFEGTEYRRARAVVETANGPIEAWIYIDADLIA